MLKKIFLKKAKEAAEKVDQAECAFNLAVKKIEELKSRSDFSLLREELIKNIYESNHLSNRIGIGYGRPNGYRDEESMRELDEVLQEIQECLDEMEKLRDSLPHPKEMQSEASLESATIKGCYGK